MANITLKESDVQEAIRQYLANNKKLSATKIPKVLEKPLVVECSDYTSSITITDRLFTRCYSYRLDILFLEDKPMIEDLIHKAFNMLNKKNQKILTTSFGLGEKPAVTHAELKKLLKFNTEDEGKKAVDEILRGMRNYVTDNYDPTILSYNKAALEQLTGHEFREINRSQSTIKRTKEYHANRLAEKWQRLTPFDKLGFIQQKFKP